MASVLCWGQGAADKEAKFSTCENPRGGTPDTLQYQQIEWVLCLSEAPKATLQVFGLWSEQGSCVYPKLFIS